MSRSLKWIAVVIFLAALGLGAGSGFFAGKMPQRSGTVSLQHLAGEVTVNYDRWGVPHIAAQNQSDMYRALGYVHAQDRLFQMEMARRLSRGELAEVLGPKLVDTDRLFRVLRIREWADTLAPTLDVSSPSGQALNAYLDGVNQFVAHGATPLEFDLLGIPKRPFTVADTLSVSGYLAYSFAAAFKTEPVMSFMRNKLGAPYLQAFAPGWTPGGVLGKSAMADHATTATTATAATIPANTWLGLAQLAQLSNDAVSASGLAQFEGSNAWAIAGRRTQSGKPILAGDPHIAFSTPAVWYEAHLSAPGFELYGHHANLVPTALLGLNRSFAWSLTMFQNDDIDLVKEKLNPANPLQAWSGDAHSGHWVDIETRADTIKVKGAAPVTLTLRRGPHGPIINDAFPLLGSTQSGGSGSDTPIALWWTLYADGSSLIDAMYALNRADTLDKARAATAGIHAPGLNVIWANAGGDIGWWAAARLPKRPAGVDPSFILDAAKGEAEKSGWYDFATNPQEENPSRGYIVSANHQPDSAIPIPGYYALPDRAIRLDSQLAGAGKRWGVADNQALQLDSGTAYGPRTLALLVPLLRQRISAADERALLDLLTAWDGKHDINLIAPTLFNQLLYEIPRAAMADEMTTEGGADMFAALLRVRGLDQAIPRLVADEASPWWDDVRTPARETRSDTLLAAWQATLTHLRGLYGPDSRGWNWGRAHQLTHGHPLGKLPPLNHLFDVGPFAAPGGHETPNNLSNPIAALPLRVSYGPSTRRVIDFAQATQSVGINPVGQSGVWGDRHYADQSRMHVRGEYRQHYLDAADVAANTRTILRLRPPAP